MINDRPPRDLRPPTESQSVTEDDITRGTHIAGRGEDAAGGDFLGEELSQLYSPAPRREHPLMNTGGPDPSSSSYSETFVEPLQSSGSALHEPLRTFYDHHLPSPDPRGTPHEEPSYVSTTGLSRTLTTPLHVALRMRHPDDPVRHDDILSVLHPGPQDAYNPLGGPSDATQLRLGSSTSLPSQGNISGPNALGVLPPTTVNDDHVVSATYYDNRGVDYDSHESSTLPVSIPRQLSSHGVGEDPTTRFVFSHVVPRRWDDLPVAGAYFFGSEQSFAARVQNEIPCGIVPPPRSPGEGQSRHSAVGPPFSNPSLTSLPAELGPRYEQFGLHRISLGSGIRTQSDTGPSRSGVATSDDPPESVPYLRNGKRKKSSDEDEGIARGLPRQRGDRTLQGSAQDQPIPPSTAPRRIKIEQTSYVCGNSQHNWAQQNPIYFTVNGQPGIRLTDALDPHFPGPDGRDDPMFQYPGAGSSVSCRLNFLGYPPRSSQITTADHKQAHNPRTRRKLASEVAKRIKRYVEGSKVGMRYEKMFLMKLVHVSKASWQPEIWYDQEPVSDS